MPGCLKCGKEVDKGKNYCADCAPRSESKLWELSRLEGASRGLPSGRPRFHGIAIGLIALLLVVLIATVSLIIAIPSGPEFDAGLQAAGCRANMQRLKRAVNAYYEVKNRFPPEGRVDSDHPLVVDEYLHRVWTCPSNDHPYQLSISGSEIVVTCDSGLEGHKL